MSTTLSEAQIRSVVNFLKRHNDVVAYGELENRLEILFPSEERETDCPLGLHEAMSIAGYLLKKLGYKEVNKRGFGGYVFSNKTK